VASSTHTCTACQPAPLSWRPGPRPKTRWPGRLNRPFLDVDMHELVGVVTAVTIRCFRCSRADRPFRRRRVSRRVVGRSSTFRPLAAVQLLRALIFEHWGETLRSGRAQAKGPITLRTAIGRNVPLLKCALATLATVLLAVTLAVPDWIERLTGVDPDAHSGALEWTLVVILAGVAVWAWVWTAIAFREARVR
jgi:hypothetical protein